MIVIKEVEDDTAELFGPGDTLIGTIDTNLQLLDIRVQIKEQKLSGYYIIWRNNRLDIDKYGSVSNWPVGFFDTLDNLLNKLIGWA